MEFQFTIPFVYDFDGALERLSGDPINHIDLVQRFVRIPMEEGNVVTLRGTGTTEHPAFQISGAVHKEQFEEVKRIFHMNDSLAEIGAHFENTDLAPLFKAYMGTPFVKSFSLYSTLMRSIIHQQLNMTFANTLSMRFVEAFGTMTDGVWRYPLPEKTAELTVEELRDMQFSTRKAEYMIGLSQAIAEGSLNLKKFKRMDDEEVMTELTSYRGVGPWTAQSFLMTGLGRPNLFPLADVGLQNALKKLWNLDRKPSKEEIIARFDDWSPYLSYAALYLWRSIE